MTCHLVVSRSSFRGYDQIADFIQEINKSGALEGWTATQKFVEGDCVLFYFTKIMCIMAVGFVNSDTRFVNGPYDWTDWNGTLTVCDYKPVWLLENPLRLGSDAESPILRKWHKEKPYRHSHRLDRQVSQALIQSIIQLNPEIGKPLKRRMKDIEVPRHFVTRSKPASQQFREGGIQEISMELIKRNPQLRSHAIAKYGYACELCGFNFGEFYGELGEGYIEVHHLRPLSDRRKTHNATVVEVRVVCANCHRVLHRNGKKPLSMQILKKAIQKRRGRTKV